MICERKRGQANQVIKAIKLRGINSRINDDDRPDLALHCLRSTFSQVLSLNLRKTILKLTFTGEIAAELRRLNEILLPSQCHGRMIFRFPNNLAAVRAYHRGLLSRLGLVIKCHVESARACDIVDKKFLITHAKTPLEYRRFMNWPSEALIMNDSASVDNTQLAKQISTLATAR